MLAGKPGYREWKFVYSTVTDDSSKDVANNQDESLASEEGDPDTPDSNQDGQEDEEILSVEELAEKQ